MKHFKFLFLTAALLAPLPAFADDYCREYTRNVNIGGRIQKAYGVACMQPDGSWQIQNEGGSQPAGYTNNYDNSGYNYNAGYGSYSPNPYATPQTIVLREPTYYGNPYNYYGYHRRPTPVVFSFNWSDRNYRSDRDHRGGHYCDRSHGGHRGRHYH